MTKVKWRSCSLGRVYGGRRSFLFSISFSAAADLRYIRDRWFGARLAREGILQKVPDDTIVIQVCVCANQVYATCAESLVGKRGFVSDVGLYLVE